MALQKQSVNINFAQGLDTKTDPKQVPVGKFARLVNSIFTKAGLLQKRNGFAQLTSLPVSDSTLATTFNGNLTSVGTSLQAYSDPSNEWIDKGTLHPVSVDVLPLVRSNINQTQADSVVSKNGLVCTVYTDQVSVTPTTVPPTTTPSYKFVIADSTTGQNIVEPTVITPSSGTVEGSPRVFILGNFFVIVFTNNISGTYHLKYISVNIYDTSSITADSNITSQYTPNSKVAFDGIVANNNLYLAWNGSDGGGALRMTYIDSTLTQHNTIVYAGQTASVITLCADSTTSTANIYVNWATTAGTTCKVVKVSQTLIKLLGPTITIFTVGPVFLNLASTFNGNCNVYYELSNNYSYVPTTASHIIGNFIVSPSFTITLNSIFVRSVGLASKAFTINGKDYFLAIYYSPDQPTYFLLEGCDGTTNVPPGNVIAKLAYSNGGSYYTVGLPSVTITDGVAQFAYFFKDLVQSTNKSNGATITAAVYSQTGINLASIGFDNVISSSSEIGGELQITGGFLWGYDGYIPVESGFFLYPDNVQLEISTSGGHLTTQDYFYVATYEWSDNQGNIFRSAPSIPVKAAIGSFSGSSNSVTVHVPTLRLTYKTANPVKIVIYRYSTANPVFYQVTSISAPILNDTTDDQIDYVDTLADTSIIGNNILYTTGGVIENIGSPPFSDITLYKSRLFGIDAEDPNLLWFSKQVIEATPVEMSDLLTQYVPPTTGAQGSTGKSKCLSAMDDKLIIFKDNAIYYMTGTGPDNTGANNDFSDPVFITATVGCSNKRSIVMMPQGLMFQSNKGIWLLGRDLSTQYIGAPVEDFNDFTVTSATTIPGTNQVRFSLSNGVVLMYDYFYGQWGTFEGVSAISSTIYQEKHTIINSRGEVYQESPGTYLDGSRPVLMDFVTGPINIAGVQGFERAYSFTFIGEYKSPHSLAVKIIYDYSGNPEQSSLISPVENFNTYYGDDPIYGSYSYGGNLTLEQWQVFFQRQKCQSFQIAIQEYFDPSLGQPAGAGLTLSGLDIMIGVKGPFPKLKQTVSVG